jgi:hypothetical protein
MVTMHIHVTRLLQASYKHVTSVTKADRQVRPCMVIASMLQTCYKHVTNMLQTCYKHVTNMLQTCYKSQKHVTNMLPSLIAKFPVWSWCKHVTSVTYMLQSCYKHVTLQLPRFIARYVPVWSWCSSMLQGCYKHVTNVTKAIRQVRPCMVMVLFMHNLLTGPFS